MKMFQKSPKFWNIRWVIEFQLVGHIVYKIEIEKRLKTTRTIFNKLLLIKKTHQNTATSLTQTVLRQ